LTSAGLTNGSELPAKKTKTSNDTESKFEGSKLKSGPLAEASKPVTTSPAPAAAISKQSRKRAADFLSDDEEEPPQVSGSKEPQPITEGDAKARKAAKKREKRKKHKLNAQNSKAVESLTADGVNGVVKVKDSTEAKVTSALKPTSTSMQAEAQRTADHELEDEWGGVSEDEIAAAPENNAEEEDATQLLTGFESDSSDVEDQGWDGKVPDIPLAKNGKKKLRKAKENSPEDEPGVVFVGHLPHGFYEDEMRGYFGQFGDITRLRLSRSKRSGASKHYAFIEFASKEVAKVVAETMNKYLIFGHILKVEVVPPERVHADTFKGANKKFRKIPHEKLEREKLAAPKSVEQWQKKNDREKKKRDKKAKKLKDTLGYDVPEVTLKDPKEAVEQAKRIEKAKAEEATKTIVKGDDENPKAIEAPKATELSKNIEVPDGDVKTNGENENADRPTKKSKKEKKDKKKSEQHDKDAVKQTEDGEAEDAKNSLVIDEVFKEVATDKTGQAKGTDEAKKEKKGKEKKVKKEKKNDNAEPTSTGAGLDAPPKQEKQKPIEKDVSGDGEPKKKGKAKATSEATGLDAAPEKGKQNLAEKDVTGDGKAKKKSKKAKDSA
jgi:nucleolar protein 15